MVFVLFSFVFIVGVVIVVLTDVVFVVFGEVHSHVCVVTTRDSMHDDSRNLLMAQHLGLLQTVVATAPPGSWPDQKQLKVDAPSRSLVSTLCTGTHTLKQCQSRAPTT